MYMYMYVHDKINEPQLPYMYMYIHVAANSKQAEKHVQAVCMYMLLHNVPLQCSCDHERVHCIHEYEH